MGLPTSFLGLKREPGNKVVGLQLRGGGEVRYFANSLHAGAAMMGSKTSSRFSSFCSTPAPVSGQSSLEIVG